MRRRQRAAGMTLIEVMVALLVATVGLLGALAMLGSVIGGASFSRRVTEASVLAQSKLEMEQGRTGITVVAPMNPPNSSPGQPFSTETLDPSGQANGSGVYTRNTFWSTSTDGQRRGITVVVTWLDGSANAHSVNVYGERIP